MIRGSRWTWTALLALGLCGPAAAGTLYRCAGGADDPVSYTSRPVAGMTCKAISYAGGRASRPAPVAYGYGPGSTAATSGSMAAPTAGGVEQATSIAIPAASGAPAVQAVASAPPRTPSGGARRVDFRTSDDGPLEAPAVPPGVQARVTRGTMYKYTRDGINTYTNVAPPSGVGAKVLFTYIETCYACSALPSVNFGRIGLNTVAFEPEIAAAARAYGVDEWLIRAIIHAESDYNPNAVSNKGAQGLMQLMPATAARFGVANAFAAADNISGGTQYLAYLSRHYNGDVKLIAAAYNAGERNVDRYGGVPPFAETMRYVERVGLLAQRYQAGR